VVGTQNVINLLLVKRNRIILPPLHVKLGIMKQFVKALDNDGECFAYLEKFTAHIKTLLIEGALS
jgi:hypothetical protein